MFAELKIKISMKKLLFAAAILISTIASAQKNSLLVGGNVGYSLEKTGDSKFETFEFSPKVGYQFADRWTIGADAAIRSEKLSGYEKTDTYKIGGFVRYAVPLSDLFSVYGDLGAGYQNDSYDNAKGMYASFTPALFINMKNGFGLNFSIGGINYDNQKGDFTPRKENFGFNFGKSISIGVSKNFGL